MNMKQKLFSVDIHDVLDYLSVRKRHFLWILPLLHFVLVVIWRQSLGVFYLDAIDPEYFHLISGAAFADLHPDPGYMDHPGIPLQIIIAIAARFVFWISGSENLLADVVHRPELYLFAANLLTNILSAVIIWWIGLKAWKYSKNFSLALSMQLAFYASWHLLDVAARIIPEAMMLLPLSLLFLLFVRYLYDVDEEVKLHKYIVLSALFVGWGIACKLSFSAFLVMPLILFPHYRNKLKVLGYSILFFFVFAFSTLSNLKHFFGWSGKMLVHSGKWGEGDVGLIDLSQFTTRIKTLYAYDSLFFVLLALLLAALIVLFIFGKRNRFNKKLLRIGLAILSGPALLVIMICKHFALHYLIPAFLFKVFFVVFILIVLQELLKKYYWSQYAQFIGFVFALSLMFFSVAQPSQKTDPNRIEKQGQRMAHFTSRVAQEDLLIISGYFAGSPFPSYALANGFHLSGPVRKFYKPVLKEAFPNRFFYNDWSDKFFHWDEYVPTDSLLNKNRRILIYYGKEKQNDPQIILQRFRHEHPEQHFALEKIYEDKASTEGLFELIVRP